MSDEHSEKTVRLLKEIRDASTQRYEQLDAQRGKSGAKRHQQFDVVVRRYVYTHRLAKQRFYILLVVVVILGLLFILGLKL